MKILIDNDKLVTKILKTYRRNIKGRIGSDDLGDDAIGLVCSAVRITIDEVLKVIKRGIKK